MLYDWGAICYSSVWLLLLFFIELVRTTNKHLPLQSQSLSLSLTNTVKAEKVQPHDNLIWHFIKIQNERSRVKLTRLHLFDQLAKSSVVCARTSHKHSFISLSAWHSWKWNLKCLSSNKKNSNLNHILLKRRIWLLYGNLKTKWYS